ncbi:hypothetical protein CEP51_013079 [Fusarium floridanum]|uniref:Uncharacterized protein n=1 Tax=Fusarium floridanum TaxID=1325733 RepID=A0A428QHS9_9HYPO|nr:hypothetical protein CEP51_013079 [Fusarium floridanum]
MSNSKRPIAVSDELRGQLERHLDDLVKSGDVEIPPGKRIRLNRAGIPKLVNVPTPPVSLQRILQIHAHTDEFLFTRSVEWGVFQTEFDELMVDEKLRASTTHADLLRRIDAVQKLVVEDFETLVGLAQELKDSPDYIKNAKFTVELPRIIGRILNELPQRAVKPTESDFARMWITLEKHHRGFYVLVKQIHQCHHDARANPDHQCHFGRVAAHCLTTLVTAMAPWDPRNDMYHKVFRSLRERVDEIRRGNREASPEVDGEVDDGTEDGTEDGAED